MLSFARPWPQMWKDMNVSMAWLLPSGGFLLSPRRLARDLMTRQCRQTITAAMLQNLAASGPMISPTAVCLLTAFQNQASNRLPFLLQNTIASSLASDLEDENELSLPRCVHFCLFFFFLGLSGCVDCSHSSAFFKDNTPFYKITITCCLFLAGCFFQVGREDFVPPNLPFQGYGRQSICAGRRCSHSVMNIFALQVWSWYVPCSGFTAGKDPFRDKPSVAAVPWAATSYFFLSFFLTQREKLWQSE